MAECDPKIGKLKGLAKQAAIRKRTRTKDRNTARRKASGVGHRRKS